MNKLKKILILLPILSTTLFIKDVKADSYVIKGSISPFNQNYYNCSDNCSNISESNILDFNFYNNNFKFYYGISSGNYYNRIVLYSLTDDKYLIYNFLTTSTCNDSDSSIQLHNYGTWYGFRCLNSSSSFNSSIQGIPNYILNENNLTFYQKYQESFQSPTTFNLNSDNIYMFYYNGSGGKLGNVYDDLSSEDLILLYIQNDKFYIDDTEIIVSSPPEPEPEPEPEIQNFNKLYVPDYNDNMCVEVIDKDTIRVFEDNETLDYTDYYVNSHYLSKTGSVDSEYIKNCTSLEKSSSFIYRNDIPEILFVSLLACVFTYLSMYLLFRVFRKRSR